MKWSDRLWMLLLVVVWGCNFTAIQVALRDVPPLLLGALRFALVAFPAVFLLRRPAIPLRWLAAYGLLMFAVQFSLLFAGMHLGMSPGLASLALQAQVFFTIGLGGVVLRERPRAWQWMGAAVAATGLGIVAWHLPGDAPLAGFACVLGAAVGWACANVLSKRFGQVHVVALVAWGCLAATPPVLAASFLLEGHEAIRASLLHLSLHGALAIAFIVYPTTLFGFALWAWQLRRYPVARVAPFTLLVPIAGMGASHLLAGEALEGWKLGAAALVVAGLGMNQFGERGVGALRALLRGSGERGRGDAP